MPLNVFDGTHRSFEHEVLPVLAQRGIAALGMKSLTGNAEPIKQGIVTPQEAIRYVLSLPIASLVSGIDSPGVLKQNLDIVRRFTPMTVAEMEGLRARGLVCEGRPVRTVQVHQPLRRRHRPPAARTL